MDTITQIILHVMNIGHCNFGVLAIKEWMDPWGGKRERCEGLVDYGD
jgi:hypothetical protein